MSAIPQSDATAHNANLPESQKWKTVSTEDDLNEELANESNASGEIDDAAAVIACLQANTPEPTKFTADEVSSLDTAQEAHNLGKKRAAKHPAICHWEMLAEAEKLDTSDEIKALERDLTATDQDIKSTPREVDIPVLTDRYGNRAMIAFTSAQWVLIPCLFAAAMASLLYLSMEYDFDFVAATTSNWGFAQKPAGAAGLVGAMSFGGFCIITLWTWAEQKTLHWATMVVIRGGMMALVGFVLSLGIGLGVNHSAKGQWLDWPMLFVPLVAIVLLVAAFGGKVFFVHVGQLLFPTKPGKPAKLFDLAEEQEATLSLLRPLRVRHSNAERLAKRAIDVCDEFAGLTASLWLAIRRSDMLQEKAIELSQNAKLAEEKAERFKRPE